MYKAEESTYRKHKKPIAGTNPNSHFLQKKVVEQKLAELHLDEHLRIIDFNGSLKKFFYLVPEDVGRPIFHFATTFSYEALVDDIEFCINNNTEHQVLIRLKTGVISLLKIIPFQQNNDKLIRLVFYSVPTQEIIDSNLVPTDRKHFSSINIEALVAKNRELTRINRELLSTSYTLAHDLKQPLSTVTKLVELLSRVGVNDLKNNGETYFNYINISLKNMKDLVNGVLEHARHIHQQKILMEWVDMNDLIQRVKISLLGVTANSDVIIHTEKLPTYVFANEIRLYQLFFNLLSNAIKFRKKNEQCRIRITAAEEASSWKFSVTDNGIGIDKKHFDNIFKLLTKLHSTEEYTGNGIGLSICKRIVEQHNGWISVSSQLGYGSTFTFTLKK